MPQIYACRNCGREYSFREFELNRFCHVCDTFLMPKNKVTKLTKKVKTETYVRRQGERTSNLWLPDGYEIRDGQLKFTKEAAYALKNSQVFLGSAPCGIGKSLGSLVAVLPQLGDQKLLVCFRTRSQLAIYLKELKNLRKRPSTISFFSKQDMCPLRLSGNLSYFEFFEECLRRRKNSKSRTSPYCKYYFNVKNKSRKAEELAFECAKKILAPWNSVKIMAKEGFCAYEALKKVLSKVDVFLGTYHYVFDTRIRHALLKSFGVSLSDIYIIVDEAHNIPAFSRELLSDRLTLRTVNMALKETEMFKHENTRIIQECLNSLEEDIFEKFSKELGRETLKRLGPQSISEILVENAGVSSKEAAEIFYNYGEEVLEKRRELGYEKIYSFNHRVGEFLNNFEEKNGIEYIHLISKDWKDRIYLEIKSFDGRELTDPVLRQSKGSILMSGFLSPPKVYNDLILFDDENCILKEYESPFPPENRLILAVNNVSSRFERRNKSTIRKITNYIESISIANKGNVAVFFTSYSLMHSIIPIIEIHREEIIEDRKTSRKTVIDQLSKSSNNLLLGVMGGKLSEGIDYPGNLLTCVVTVGLPYATWDIYQRALINYYEQKFPGEGRKYAYLTPAILRLIQTSGRVHRSARDKGCIIMLDQRVLIPEIRKQLPIYFQKEIKIVNEPENCAELIRNFWLNNSSNTPY